MYSAPIGDIGWARTNSTSPPGVLSVAAIAGDDVSPGSRSTRASSSGSRVYSASPT
jgi:hypothetical protein